MLLRPALLSEQFAAMWGSRSSSPRAPNAGAAGDAGLARIVGEPSSRRCAPRSRTRRDFPAAVHSVCARIVAAPAAELEAPADLLIAARSEGVDAQAAPFVMAALQVYWAAMASTLQVKDVAQLDVPTVCPVCGSLLFPSVVRGRTNARRRDIGTCTADYARPNGIWCDNCSHCLTNEGITYHSIEGSSDAVRAETCGKCHTYRKILYRKRH